MPQKQEKDGSMVDKTEADLTYIEKQKLLAQIKLQAESELRLTSEQGSLYNFIFRRCTDLLQDRIQAHSRYKQVDNDSDPFALLAIIREIVHKIESSAYAPFSIIEQTDAIFKMRQGSHQTVAQFHAQFKSMLDALATQGGDVCRHSDSLSC